MYELTEDEFEAITEYFELALTAISDDEQEKLVALEFPLREMLRDIRSKHLP